MCAESFCEPLNDLMPELLGQIPVTAYRRIVAVWSQIVIKALNNGWMNSNKFCLHKIPML